jgi:uncharacterized YccA/Bax inhibitor family protein
MALFESGNPTLSEKMFDKAGHAQANAEGTMSVRGTMNKFGLMLIGVIAGAGYTWHLIDQNNPTLAQTLMIVGVIGGLITALAITFKPNWAPALAPAYAILEGLFLGAISKMFNDAFYPGIVVQAVGLTLGVAVAMFLLYNFRVIKPTEKFKSMMMSAMLGIAIFYLLTWVLGLFGVDVSFVRDNSMLSIGISLFIVAIAALNLILDFDMIEQGAQRGAPQFMEWYAAFGLMVTIVWLYLEILRLLSKLSSRD